MTIYSARWTPKFNFLWDMWSVLLVFLVDTAWQAQATAATASALPSDAAMDTAVTAQATAATAPVSALTTIFTWPLPPVS